MSTKSAGDSESKEASRICMFDVTKLFLYLKSHLLISTSYLWGNLCCSTSELPHGGATGLLITVIT